MDPSRWHTPVVANRTAATPILLRALREIACERHTAFTLLVPETDVRPQADWTLETAVELVERAVRSPVDGVAGGPDPYEAVDELVADADFDDVVVAAPSRSEWLEPDLPSHIEGLGLSVTVIGEPDEGGAVKRPAGRVMVAAGG